MDKVLTIIVPAYNMEPYIQRCCNSMLIRDELLNQIEVLIINDGSSDSTSVLAHRYEHQHPGVFRVIDKLNGHYGSCVNKALSVANGLYVKMLDADDLYLVDSFEQYVEALIDLISQGLMPDVVFNDAEFMFNDGRIVPCTRLPLPSHVLFDDMYLFNHMPVLQMTKMSYRRQVLVEMRYAQTEGVAYTDNEWIFYPLFSIKTCFYLPICVYRYFIGREEQSMDPSVIGRAGPAMIKIAARMNDFLKEAKDRKISNKKIEYARRIANGMLAGGYVNALRWLNNKDATAAFIEIEELLSRDSQDMYADAAELSFPKSAVIKFEYVRHFRKYNKIGKIYQFVFRFAFRLPIAIGKVKKIVRRPRCAKEYK